MRIQYGQHVARFPLSRSNPSNTDHRLSSSQLEVSPSLPLSPLSMSHTISPSTRSCAHRFHCWERGRLCHRHHRPPPSPTEAKQDPVPRNDGCRRVLDLHELCTFLSRVLIFNRLSWPLNRGAFTSGHRSTLFAAELVGERSQCHRLRTQPLHLRWASLLRFSFAVTTSNQCWRRVTIP